MNKKCRFNPIILGISAIMIFTMAGCSNNAGITGSGPQISISEIKETEAPQKEQEKNKVNQSGMTTVIDDEVANLIGSDFQSIIEEVKDSVSVEETEDGIRITTESLADRGLITNSISQYASKSVSDFRAETPNATINYDLYVGYIDIYCTQKETDNVIAIVNKLSGFIALNQKITNNTKDWVVTVTINDAETGELVIREGVYANTSFTLTDSDWNKSESSSIEEKTETIINESEEKIDEKIER